MKKILPILLFLTTSTVWAADFYIAPNLEYEAISVDDADYGALVPRVAVGVGGGINNTLLYLGGELFGNFVGLTLHNNTGPTPGLKFKYNVGASIMPGYYLDDVLLGYLRLGPIITHFQELDTTRTGWQIGVGLQANLSPCLDMRGEYVYTGYPSLTGVGSPRGDEYMLGLVYKFQ